MMLACNDGVSSQLDTWTRVLNVEMTFWMELRHINDAFGRKGSSLMMFFGRNDSIIMMFLAREMVMSSRFQTSRDPKRWSGWISTLGTSYK